MAGPHDRVPRFAYLALFAGAFLARNIFLAEMRESPLFTTPVGDARAFDQWGQAIAAGDWVGQGVFYQAPGVSYVLGSLYALFGRDLELARQLFACCGALTCVLVADLGRRVLDRRAGLLAGWILALYAPLFFFEARLQKPALSQLLLVATLHTLVRHRQNPGSGKAFCTGLACVGAALVRENIWVLAPVLPFLVASPVADLRTRGGWLAALVLGAGLAFAPLALRNHLAGVPLHATTSNLGPNLYIGNHQGADGLYRSLRAGRGMPGTELEDARSIASDAAGRPLQDAEVSAWWRDRALDWMRAEPRTALALFGTKLGYVLHAREWMDTVSYRVACDESRVLRILGFVFRFGILVPLGLVGIVLALARGRRSEVTPLLVAGVLLAASVAAFFVFARLRLPLVPLLAPFAALTVLSSIRRARAGDHLALLRIGVPVALIGVLVHLPTGTGEYPRANTWNNLATAARLDGQTGLALEYYRRALVTRPDFPQARFNLGLLAAKRGRVEEAREHLEAATSANPAWRLEGFLALAEGHLERDEPEEALMLLEQARRERAERPELALRAARLYRRAGDLERAVMANRAALALRPAYPEALNNLGYTLALLGRLGEAREAYEVALEFDPAFTKAVVNLGWLLSSAPDPGVRDGRQALVLADRALELLGHESAAALDLSAAALAELGRYSEAELTAGRALSLAQDDGREEFAAEVRARLLLYRQGLPYRP